MVRDMNPNGSTGANQDWPLFMRRIVIILGLMSLAWPAMAQNQTPDMPFTISFSALSNSPPTPGGLSGLAAYYRTTKPFLPGMPSFTNLLEVFIGLPATPVSAWVLEQQADGSFTPVVELTDPYHNGYFDQNVLLTTNQIYSMIAGNLYAEVDFDDGSYLGNFAPQYAFVPGPTVKMIFPTPIGDNIPSGYTAISPNNHTARVVLDGSHCTDPFYLPIQFSWIAYAGYFWDPSQIVFTGTNMMATNVYKLGFYNISLQVADVIATNRPYGFSLRVITAGQAVNTFIPLMRETTMPPAQRLALTEVLSGAASLFNQGQMAQGCAALEVYKQLVKAGHFDDRAAYVLQRPMQDVLDAFKKNFLNPRGGVL